MAKSGVGTGRAQKPVMEWVNERLDDPAVQELMAEIDLRQDLIALRESKNMTQVQLAQKLGVTQSVIAKLEGRYTKDVKLSTLVKVAAALGARVKIGFETVAVKRAAKKKRVAA